MNDKLPYVYADAVYHLGDLPIEADRVHPRDYIVSWNFEFGLLSISLKPESWRTGWAGERGRIYSFTLPDGPFRFLELDHALRLCRNEIIAAALSNGLITLEGSEVLGTEYLYNCLGLSYPSMTYLKGRSTEDQVIQAALSVMSFQDPSLHGVWWHDLLGGEMRTSRGGIFPHVLPDANVEIVAAVLETEPRPYWQTSKLL